MIYYALCNHVIVPYMSFVYKYRLVFYSTMWVVTMEPMVSHLRWPKTRKENGRKTDHGQPTVVRWASKKLRG